jgi:hypothetical protein
MSTAEAVEEREKWDGGVVGWENEQNVEAGTSFNFGVRACDASPIGSNKATMPANRWLDWLEAPSTLINVCQSGNYPFLTIIDVAHRYVVHQKKYCAKP